MFSHLFFYRLKCLLRNRTLVFWTLLYPLFMATILFVALSNLMGDVELEPAPAAVVDNSAYRESAAWQQMFDALSQPGEGQLLELTVTDERSASELLASGEVAGVITLSAQGPQLSVQKSGFNQSLLKAILDEFLQSNSTATRILRERPEAAAELMRILQQRTGFTEQTSFSPAPPDTTLNYFYALVAMTCMFCAFWGLENSTQTQADLSPQGMRRGITPTHKLQVILADTTAAWVVALAEVLLLVAFLMLVIGVNFGSRLGFVLLLCLVGSLTGVAWGTFLGTAFRTSENLKTGVLVSSSLITSFLAGLMFANMKDIVARNVPLLAYINPAALITDGLYSLYIYEHLNRFWLNFGLLGLITGLLCLGSYFFLRGERYASL